MPPHVEETAELHRDGAEKPMHDVLRLDRSDVADVVDVLCESFFDYPVMRFVLGEPGSDYGERLRTLVDFFVMARVHRGETLLGIRSEGGLVGTALVSRPGRPAPPELRELGRQVWKGLGSDAEARYAAFGNACAPFQVEAPHVHLNMIGVRRTHQGRGLSRSLIERVHDLSFQDTDSAGVTLTTEDPENVPLYRHFGYQVVGRAAVAPNLTTWGFFRPDSA